MKENVSGSMLGMRLTTLVIVAAAFVSANPQGAQEITQRDEDGVQCAAFARLFRDYCSWNPRIRTVYLSAPNLMKDGVDFDAGVNPTVLESMKKLLPFTAYAWNESLNLSSDVELLDTRTKKPAALLQLTKIEWVARHKATVAATFIRSGRFQLFVNYTIEQAGKAWQVMRTELNGETDKAVLSGQNGKHRFLVELRAQPFALGNHTVKLDSEHGYLIDGGHPWGVDGSVPWAEFSAFRVMVDGTPWSIPKRLWRDCYQPNLTSPDSDTVYVYAWLSKDGSRLTVKMLGGDAAGSYTAIWRLKRNGKHTRTVVSTC